MVSREYLDGQEQLLIEKMTRLIRSMFDIPMPVTDPAAAITAMGGELIPTIILGEYEDSVIKKTKPNGFGVLVSSRKSPERQAYEAARAIGRLFLRLGYRISPDLWADQPDAVKLTTGDLTTDRQVNRFADMFLMPADEIKSVAAEYTANGMVDTDAVARHFNVPIDIAAARMTWLRIIQGPI